MPRIERIEIAGPDAKARRLVFSCETEPRTTSAAALRCLGLAEGDEVRVEVLAEELERVEHSCARERALRVLGHRDRSATELSRRLIEDGYPSETAHAVVDRLCEVGLVDDERFACAWARTRAAARFGPSRIARELSSKGIDPDLATRAIGEAFWDSDAVSAARALAAGVVPTTSKERDRLYRKLIGRGFGSDIARTVLDELDSHDGDEWL